MKVRFSQVQGCAVIDFSVDANMDQLLQIVQDPANIKISITKETTAQYFKRLQKEAKHHENH